MQSVSSRIWTRVAVSISYDDNHYTTGTSTKTYATLSIEMCADYKIVKNAIQKSYELVPEEYSQKFRNCKKIETQTYVDLSRQKETCFER